MSAPSPSISITVRTRLGQVIDRPLSAEEATEVHEALSQMIAVLFDLQRPEQIRSVTFEIGRPD